jgi:hypothetical protein
VSDALFWGTLLLLISSTIWTIWRTRGVVSTAVLAPVAWIALIGVPVALRPLARVTDVFPDGFIGTPRDRMNIAIAISNVAFLAFQFVFRSSWFKKLQDRTVGLFTADNGNSDRLLRNWVIGLAIVAGGLAAIHMALMPRVPAWDLVTGFTDPLQPNYDREAADKFLPVPTVIRYVFDWNQGIVFPILFTATVLLRWKPMAIIVGIFGFIYMISTLEKFPSLLFLISPFIAVAVRDSRPIWSRLVIGGLLVSLLGPLAVNQAPGISTSIHAALNATPPASATPTYDPSLTTPVAGCDVPPPAAAPPFDWRQIPRSVADLVLRRIGLVPAEVTYGWFAYFPDHGQFLNGSGWEPWKVLSSGYRNPANLVGLFMYCGHSVTLPTVSAYGSFIADGWAEFGYVGVIIGCLGIVLFGLLLELMRGFTARAFCLACYGPSVILFATLPPRAGLLATVVSSGLWLAPVLCFLFLVSQRFGGRLLRFTSPPRAEVGRSPGGESPLPKAAR